MDSDAGDRWYSVRVLMEIAIGEEGSAELSDRFEDRIILVRAADETQALTKGIAFAQGTNEEYLNATGERVRWTFSHALEAHQILDASLQDGTEVYSAFVNQELAQILIRGGDSPVKAWLR